jgi:hypothetical protein
MRLIRIALAVALALSPVEALAQGGSVTAYSTTDFSGSVTTANTYQVVQPYNAYRHGCMIQNTSANIETVRVNTTVYTLSAGAVFSCISGGIVVNDAIAITSPTAASTYSAGFQ